MNRQNTLYFIPLNELADERSGGRVVGWITSWWKDVIVVAWGGRALNILSPDDSFQLYTQYRPILCTPTPASMETVVEVFNGDCLSHPHIPHVFAIPRFMNHLWRRQLSKDADILFTINVWPYFWP